MNALRSNPARNDEAARRETRLSLGTKIFIGAVAAVLGVAFAVGGYLGRAPAPTRLETADAATIALGQQVYEARCAACHGKNLEGEPNWREKKPSGRMPAPPHDDSGHTWHHPDAVLFGITKEGLVPGKYAPPGYQSDMPGFAGALSDDEIWAVLAFIANRWSERAREHQARITREAAARRRPDAARFSRRSNNRNSCWKDRLFGLARCGRSLHHEHGRAPEPGSPAEEIGCALTLSSPCACSRSGPLSTRRRRPPRSVCRSRTRRSA